MSAVTSYTFSAASGNVANMQEVAQGARGGSGSVQAIRVFGRSAGTSGSATLQLVLVDKNLNKALARFTGTATCTSRKSDPADSSTSEYVCDISWNESSNSKFDLLGCGDQMRWYLGVTAFATISAITLSWITTQDI